MKLLKIQFLLIFAGLLLAAPVFADTSTRGCETNTMKSGEFCNWAEGKSWCAGNTLTCAVESTTPCPANPANGTYAFSCNSNSCVLSCNSGYTNCSGTCTINGSMPNCTTYNTCAGTCTTCAPGYTWNGSSCAAATLKLGSTSVSGATGVIQAATNPQLFISGTTVGLGISNPTANLHLFSNNNTEGLRIISSNYSPFIIRNTADTEDLFRIDQDGNITSKGSLTGSNSFWNINGSNLYASSTTWNVGIGTKGPTGNLEIYRTTAPTTDGSSNALMLTYYGGQGLNELGAGINFKQRVSNIVNTGVSSVGGIYGVKTNSAGAYGGGLAFYSTNGVSTSLTERMRIDSAGNVGIGTTNPQKRLDLGGGTNGRIYGIDTSTSAIFTDSEVVPKKWIVDNFAPAVGGVSLWATSSTGIYNVGLGNVGIGITNPTEKLTVVGAINSNSTVNGTSLCIAGDCKTSWGDAGWSFDGNTVGQTKSFGTLDNYAIPFLSNGVERMRLTESGNFVIGATSTGVRLHVESPQGAVAFFKSKLNGGSYAGYIGNGQTFTGEEFGLYYALNDQRMATYNLTNSLLLYGGHLSSDPALAINAAGDVGIGTTNPQKRLDLGGGTNGRIYGIDTSTSAIFTDSEVVPKKWIVDNFAPAVGGASLWATSSTGIYNVGLGNVGIGKTNPNFELDLSGNIRFGRSSPGYGLLASDLYGGEIGLTDENDVAIAVKWDNGNFQYGGSLGSDRGLFINSSGNVGIGTTTPGYKLDVSSASTGVVPLVQVKSGGGGFIMGSYGSSWGGMWSSGVTPTISNYKMLVHPTFGLAFNAPTGGMLQFLINDSPKMAMNVNGLAINNGAAGPTAGNGLIVTTGNVGIGTTDPRAKLDVRGSLYVGDYGHQDGAFSVKGIVGKSIIANYRDQDGENVFKTEGSVGNNNLFVRFGDINDASNGTNFLIDQGASRFIFNAGNVGIGTTTPSSKLHIAGGVGSSFGLTIGSGSSRIYESALNNLVISSSVVSINPGTTLNLGTSGSSSVNIGRTDSGFTAINSAGGETIRITSGKVGIGTTTPATRLTVIGSGNYSIDAGNYRIGNVATPTGPLDAVNKSYLDSAVGTAQNAFWNLSGSNLYASSTSWNVGIGTTSPTAKLHVIGNAIISTSLTMGGDINMGSNNITNLTKLTVNTIDPLYNIKGVNYSTFAASVVGGVKEEYVGRIKLTRLIDNGEYEAVVDFDQVKEGSDLWVWRHTVDFSADNVQVLITPYGGFAEVYYQINGNSLVLRADRPADISYRLIGKRLDWRQWPTRAKDQEEKAGFVID